MTWVLILVSSIQNILSVFIRTSRGMRKKKNSETNYFRVSLTFLSNECIRLRLSVFARTYAPVFYERKGYRRERRRWQLSFEKKQVTSCRHHHESCLVDCERSVVPSAFVALFIFLVNKPTQQFLL
jgi:hypothetical protein